MLRGMSRQPSDMCNLLDACLFHGTSLQCKAPVMEHGCRFVSKLYRLLNRDVRGQALIETAVSLPFLLALAFNVINFGYFFVIAVNLASSPRTGTLYSIFGSQTPSTPGLPTPALVNTLTKADLTGG